MTLADLRKDYSLAGLNEKDLARDPFRQFDKWFQEAEAAKIIEPNAMTLAHRDARRPALSPHGACSRAWMAAALFSYTNYESRKGRELQATPRAALFFRGSLWSDR